MGGETIKKILGEEGIGTTETIMISVIVTAAIVGSIVYFATGEEEPVSDNELPEEKQVKIGVQHFADFSSMWCASHNQSLQNLVDRFDWLEMTYAEEVAPEDIPSVAEDMISGGADLVFQDTEFITVPIEEIYQDYPDVYFGGIIVGEPGLGGRNWIRNNVKSHQARYLAGLVMGALTETDRIGMVVSFESGDPIARVNAITLGIREVNPDAEVYIGEYVGSWYDPPTESEISELLVDDYNVDVLHNPASDSLAPLEVAQDKGVWFVGKDADLVGEGFGTEETVALSYKNNWESMYMETITDYLTGKENPQRLVWKGYTDPYVDEDGNKLYPNDIVNNGRWGADAISQEAREVIGEEIVDLVRRKRELMIMGAYDPFTKELRAAETGEIISEEGVMPSMENIFTMDQYIEGVVAP